MNNTLLLIIGKSLIITLVVSTIFGIIASSFGFSFLPSFSLFTLLQFIGFYFYGEHIKRKNNKIKLEAELKIFEEQSKQITIVTCPCDRNIETTIPININGENKYKCPGLYKGYNCFCNN
jgi:hypothetical protein